MGYPLVVIEGIGIMNKVLNVVFWVGNPYFFRGTLRIVLRKYDIYHNILRKNYFK